MVYSAALRNAGNQFLVNHLNYNPGEGNGRQSPFNGGGMYIGAHLRRKDFLYSHKGTVPSLEGVVNQLNVILEHQRLTAVFIASDDIMDDKCKIRLSLYCALNCLIIIILKYNIIQYFFRSF